jgi:hypothetical protein
VQSKEIRGQECRRGPSELFMPTRQRDWMILISHSMTGGGISKKVGTVLLM